MNRIEGSCMDQITSLTLGEIKSICVGREDCAGCLLQNSFGDCRLGGKPKSYDLGAVVRFSDRDRTDAQKLAYYYGRVTAVGRNKDGSLWIFEDGKQRFLNHTLLPSLKPGETILLDEVFG